MNTIQKTCGKITVADYDVTFGPKDGKYFIKIVDTFDTGTKRQEEKLFDDEGIICSIISDFMRPDNPGPMFVKHFQFWT